MKVRECTIVAPIADQEGGKSLFIIRRAWSVECHWACKAIWVLQRIMTMIPGTPILSDVKLVGKAISRGNWALCHSIDSIHRHGMKLSDAMPMDRSAIPLEVVRYFYFELVAPASLYPRTRVLSIECFSTSLEIAIGVDRQIADCQVVRALDAYGPFLIEIGKDIQNFTSDLIDKPGASLSGVSAVFPAYHRWVFAQKALRRIRRRKHRSFWQGLNGEIASNRLLMEYFSPGRDGRQSYKAGESLTELVEELHLSNEGAIQKCRSRQ